MKVISKSVFGVFSYGAKKWHNINQWITRPQTSLWRFLEQGALICPRSKHFPHICVFNLINFTFKFARRRLSVSFIYFVSVISDDHAKCHTPRRFLSSQQNKNFVFENDSNRIKTCTHLNKSDFIALIIHLFKLNCSLLILQYPERKKVQQIYLLYVNSVAWKQND